MRKPQIQNPKSQRNLKSQREPDTCGGFTLLELLISILIIAVVAGVLLEMRLDIVRDAVRIKTQKTAWELAARKMAEFGIDKDKNFFKEPTTNRDTFEDQPEYGYEYTIEKEQIQTQADPNDSNQKPKEIMKVTLVIKVPEARSEEEHITLVSYYPMYEEEKPQQPQQPAQGQPR